MFAPRVLRKHWRLTAAAVFSLSIAMAVGVLSLSVSNTVLLLPPAAPDPDRLVMIHGRSGEKEVDQISYPDYKYYRQNNRVFTDIAAAPNSISLFVDTTFAGREARAMARPVSDNYFDVMGIRPYMGRFFSPGDDESHPQTAIMTYLCWKRLGADPHIIGKKFGANTIIGVTPRSFTGSFYGLNGDLLTPLSESGDPSWLNQRNVRRFFLIARLKPGVSRRQAQAEMTGLSAQLAKAYPKEDKNRTAVLGRATLLPPDALPTAELADGILVALVLLVLLIACANVANLLLALAVGRRQEAAIKLALGATRRRVMREFLQESSVLCFASAVLGFSIAAWVIARFSNFSIEFPMLGTYSFGLNLRLDMPVLVFTIALMVMASVAAGLAPALYASSPDIAPILCGEMAVGGTGKAARRNVLVVLQVAVCTTVLIGLGLCQRNLFNLRHTNIGFSARNLVAMTNNLTNEGYSETRGRALYRAMRDAVAALPGVQAVTLALDVPLSGANPVPVRLPDRGEKLSVGHTVVDANYFSTIGVPLLEGRVFNSDDREKSTETIVINRKMAETFWPGRDPVGKVIFAGEPESKFTIIGVVADGKYEDLDEPRRPFMFYALSQHYQGTISAIARTAGDPRMWVEPVDRAIHAQGIKAPVRPVTFERWMNLLLLTERISTGIVAALSLLGLLLAVLGLWGAVSYSVSQRKRELGIRIALGARTGQLATMVLRQVLRIAGVGVVVGTLSGVGATILLRSKFYQIGAVEWRVLIPVSVAMLSVSLGVAYLSAKPWIDADPMEAVRHN